ncbi:DciA family protein [Fusobacterium sp. PH5-44]|uniref:DciA family protein n=1 Tax=unclassified Fusobacterium TaxID=2648384 RepID=UPI003D236E6D
MEMIKKNPKFKEGYIRANWKEIVGNLETKASIYYLKDDKLFVKVDNSTILHFMKMNSNRYVEKINELFHKMEFYEEREETEKFIKELHFMINNKN